jgi:hypothetical protein
MPTFRIQVTNTDTEAISEVDRPDPHEARAEALKSALQIGVDEVCKGKPFFGAEVRIKSGRDIVERLVVAIGVSPLR